MKHRDQHWADPFERPDVGRWDWLPVVFAWLLAIAAAGVLLWRYAV